MKLIVDLNIICDAPGTRTHLYAIVRKEFQSDLIPMVGMEFEDPAWKDPRSIKSILINPTEGYYLLRVGNDTLSDKVECEQLKQMYHSHGWTGLVR